MGFQKNVELFKNNTPYDVERYAKINNKSNLLGVSFNSQTCANKDTKLVIVGTYTPKKGRENGYFYTSSRVNYTYRIIDDYFGLNGELTSKKEYLSEHKKDAQTIIEIKNILTSLNIAFIDVIDFAISPDDCANDDEIEYFCLDNKTFNVVNDKTIFVCNSRNSEYAFKTMFPSKICEYATQKRQRKSYDWHYNNWEIVLDKYYDRDMKCWKI